MNPASYLSFVAICFIFALTPGPDNLMVISTGLTRGKKAAFFMAMGMCSGISLHTLAAAFGISAIFYTSTLAFSLVKFAGAAYLLFLAFKTITAKTIMSATQQCPPKRAAQYYRQGFLLNTLNPKVALFFLAFLPQFVNPEAGNISLQICILGMLFVLPAIILFSLIAVFAGSIGGKIFQKPQTNNIMKIIAASVLAALGLKLAFSKQ